jgi:outer membrane protein assembly factor BamB
MWRQWRACGCVHTFSNTHASPHSDANASPDADTDANTDADADSQLDSGFHTNADTHTDADSSSDADTDTYTYSHTDADSASNGWDCRDDSMRESPWPSATIQHEYRLFSEEMSGNLRTTRAVIFGRCVLFLMIGASTICGLSGCGSGSSTVHFLNATRSAGKGRAAFTFTWPQRKTLGRLIPVDANSIRVNVSAADGSTAATQLLARPGTGTSTATVTFTNLNVGAYTVAATAYPNADGTGVAQANAQTAVTVVQDQLTPVNLTMASTIASITLTTSATTLTAGQSAMISAHAVDAQGNVVMITPTTFQWTSSVPGVAAVDTTGNLTCVAGGTTTITAVDSETGKSANLAITVNTVPDSTLAKAVAYQMTVGHTGSVSFGIPLSFPTSPSWTVQLGGKVSYPLIAGGKVFVTTALSSGGYGANLYALDERTGHIVWGPIALGGTYFWAGLTYDNGKVFAINGDGLMQSFDASSGKPSWAAQMPGQYGFDAAPTAANGIVYVGGAGTGGTVYAVNEANGKVLWTASVENGDESSPAISLDGSGKPDGIYVSYPCQVYKFDPTTGASLWHYNGPCEGGGGKTAAYANGLLYVRDGGGTIFDAATGNETGAFNGGTIPALGSTTGYFMSGHTLQGVNLSTRSAIWSFTGDGSLVTAPIAVDQTVFVGSASGNVYALDAASGNQLWSGAAGAAIDGPDEQNVSQPLTGMAAGEGYLVVPAGTTVAGWHIAGS